jgi:hypothetical protein
MFDRCLRRCGSDEVSLRPSGACSESLGLAIPETLLATADEVIQ